MQENIRSYVRIKPDNDKPDILVSEDNKTISVPNNANSYTIDKIFGINSTNQQIYQEVGANMVKKSLEGYNCCIFAYGQTSSGKTHTIKGSQSEKGLIQLALNDIFGYDRKKYQVEVHISYIEIYNDVINDLLNKKQNIALKEKGEKELHFQGLQQKQCFSYQEAIQHLELGEKNRKYGTTQMNTKSSRSHCILRIKVITFQKRIQKSTVAFVNIIDLAGSQSVQKTKAEGMTKYEGTRINTSLLNLSKVIVALIQRAKSNNPNSYVNFRDCKLTRILESSLNGNSKTVIICTVSGLASNLSQTHNSIKFAANAGQIKLSSKANFIQKSESSAKKSIISRDFSNQKQNNHKLNNELKAKLKRSDSQIQQLTKNVSNRSQQIESLKISLQLAEKKVAYRDLRIQKLESQNKKMKDQIQELNNHCQKLEKQNNDAKIIIKKLQLDIEKLALTNTNLFHNQQIQELSIKKLTKQNNDITRSYKQQKKKQIERRRKQVEEHSPLELSTMMNHAITLLDKNKTIVALQNRVQQLQSQIFVDYQQSEPVSTSTQKRNSCRKMIRKSHLKRMNNCNEKNSHWIKRYSQHIIQLQKQLLEYKLAGVIDKNHGKTFLKSILFQEQQS